MMNTTAYGFSGSSSNGIDSSLASRKPIEILKNTIQSIADSTKNYKLAYLTLGLGQTEEF